MLVLGIESSCDECAAALVGRDNRLLAQTVASQIELHSKYGGVVPELASRDHVRRILPVIDQTLKKAERSLQDVAGIGVTMGPGLIGSLLVGVMAAKGLAWSLNIPLVGVNHLEAHLFARFLEEPRSYPYLGLVVSGGHTSLFRVEDVGRIRLLGQTLDDAAGEAFDKVSKLLGLGYPGGVYIERAARLGNPAALRFPRPLAGKKLAFSFSGLKTAVAVKIKQIGLPQGSDLHDFAAAFQEAVVDSLVEKTLLAAKKEKLERVIVAGGVAANGRLREKMQQRGEEEGISVVFPSKSLCTDNAAMVAGLSKIYLERGLSTGTDVDADAGLTWKNR